MFEQPKEIELDPITNPYKQSLFTIFRGIQDPFGIEVIGDKFDY